MMRIPRGLAQGLTLPLMLMLTAAPFLRADEMPEPSPHPEENVIAYDVLLADPPTPAPDWRFIPDSQRGGSASDQQEADQATEDDPSQAAGRWESPALPASPGGYYLVELESHADPQTWWAVIFEKENGRPLRSDAYDGIGPFEPEMDSIVADLTRRTAGAKTSLFSVVRVHPEATAMRLRIHGTRGDVGLTAVRISRVSPEQARLHLDELALTIPAVDYVAPEDRWNRLPRTLARLREGRLRVVMLGDSICNDTSNGLWELHLKDAWPDATIDVVTSVRGGTGMWWYQAPGRLETYALRFKPDLLVIAGVSHQNDSEAMRSVVRQAREAGVPEVLVLSGAITPHETLRHNKFKALEFMRTRRGQTPETLRTWMAQAVRDAEMFPSRLKQMTDQEQVAYFDMRAAWDAYVTLSWRDPAMYLRDPIHANRYGKQVAARLLAQYLRPPASERE